MALAALALGPARGLADFVFVASGNSSQSGSLNAEADFQVIKDQITVTIKNLQTDIGNVGQAISGISFDISNPPPTSLTLKSTSGDVINIANGGAVTDLGFTTYSGTSGPDKLSAGRWHLDTLSGNPDPNMIALGGGQPDHLIIGPANSNGEYPNANGSLKGQFNPFFQDSVTLVLNAPGVMSSSTISNVVFLFGTSSGEFTLNGKPENIPVVPAPSSVILLGVGAFGLLGFTAVLRLRWTPAAA
ncbi:MAG TPA: XDD4 family exosortase-dependent surface protein [Gemmataceae bacterium]